MDELGRLIKKRINLLAKAINVAESEKDGFPEGRLRLSGSKRTVSSGIMKNTRSIQLSAVKKCGLNQRQLLPISSMI